MPTEAPVLSQEGTWDNVTAGSFDATMRPTVGGRVSSRVACWRFTGLTLGTRGGDDDTGPTAGVEFYQSGTFTVTVSTFAADAVPCDLVLYARRQASPGVWDADTQPGFGALAGVTSVSPVGALVGTLVDVEVSRRRFTTAPTGAVTFTLTLAALASLLAFDDWDGTVSLWMSAEYPSASSTPIVWANNASDATPAVLALVSDLRSLTSYEAVGGSRAYRCDRCGAPALLEHLVRDGDQPGLRVHPSTCYDIEQLPHRTTRGERRRFDI